jgi:hypothetical protein
MMRFRRESNWSARDLPVVDDANVPDAEFPNELFIIFS